MVTKLKEMADKQAAALLDSALANQVRDSAQQIWLAGMGAFSKAQAEGRQVFETLVKEGTSLQKKTQAVAEERLDEVSSKVTSLAGDATARAGQQWDRLETIFEERTARALSRLGVPSAKEVEALKARIDELGAELERRSATVAKPAVARKSPLRGNVARPAVKRTVRKAP